MTAAAREERRRNRARGVVESVHWQGELHTSRPDVGGAVMRCGSTARPVARSAAAGASLDLSFAPDRRDA